MNTTISALVNQQSEATQASRSMSPLASSSTQDPGSVSVSANDFLTLLVTEMKNQDPTANTDPNQYINQLVQVNSLQQLISINETLHSDASGTNTTPHAIRPERGTSISGAPALAAGNLSVPATSPAALRVSQSLLSRSAMK